MYNSFLRCSTTWERAKTGEACVLCREWGGSLTIDLMPDVTLDDPTIQCDDVGKLILMMTGPAPMMVMPVVMMMMFKGGRGGGWSLPVWPWPDCIWCPLMSSPPSVTPSFTRPRVYTLSPDWSRIFTLYMHHMEQDIVNCSSTQLLKIVVDCPTLLISRHQCCECC